MVPSKSRGRGEALAAVGPSLHIDPMWRFLFLALAPVAAHAGPFAGTVADVYVLGEVHDNPVHHAAQADAIRDIEPRAGVFEMLAQAQADEVRDDRLGDPEALGALLGWEEAGWPDFSMYYPIFAASRGAQVFGAAVPRESARAAMEVGVARSFGEGAADYGLEDDLEAEVPGCVVGPFRRVGHRRTGDVLDYRREVGTGVGHHAHPGIGQPVRPTP